MANLELVHNPAARRFEAYLDGELVGSAYYTGTDQVVVFTHTEVDDAVQGRGVASALARAALDDARSRGLRVVPRCPFISGWIERHPEYGDLAA